MFKKISHLIAGLTDLVPGDGSRGGSPEGSPKTFKARNNVTAFQADKQALTAAMQKHPELSSLVYSELWRQQSDLAVAEAISALHFGETAAF